MRHKPARGPERRRRAAAQTLRPMEKGVEGSQTSRSGAATGSGSWRAGVGRDAQVQPSHRPAQEDWGTESAFLQTSPQT